MGKIMLFNGWYLDIPLDGRSYVLTETRKATKKGAKKEEADKIYGYYGSLEQALKGFRNIYGRKLLAEKETCLADAIQLLHDIDDRIEKLFDVMCLDGIDMCQASKTPRNKRVRAPDDKSPTRKKTRSQG